MASEKDTPRTRSENIKTNLQSISTCTASTVAELQGLLADKSDEIVQKENLRVKRPQLLSVQAGTRKKAGSVTTPPPGQQTTPGLTPRERYILATEAANITLKSLADALKTQPPRKSPTPKLPSKDDAHTRNPSRTQALKERSISQAINSPIKPSSLRRSLSSPSSLTTGPSPGLVATAECARVAFSYLRSPAAGKTAGKDVPALQLESGILALIGKLVAHNLDSLAIKELRVLKKRLDHYAGKDTVDRTKRSINGKTKSAPASSLSEKESLASLLDFGEMDHKCPILPLVITHQTYTLRLIANARRPRLVEESWAYLKLSNTSSPANLIWHAAKESNGDPKLIRQLESLAQTVLSLCPSISASEDVSKAQGDPQPPAEIVVSLQQLAFKIRQRWWALANHQGNEENELLEPFSRCLAAFARRADLPAVKKYKVAEALFCDLLGPPDSWAGARQGDSFILAAKTLSSLAQTANLPEDAIRWLSASGNGKSKDSAAGVATRLVRAATLSLDVFINDSKKPNPERAITDALEALSGGLGGSASALDSLFIQVNAFRRAAARALLTSSQSNATISQLHYQASRIISASVRFSARYLGPSTAVDTNPQAESRYKQRAQAVNGYLKSIIDSACICSKLPVGPDSEKHWTNLDVLFQDCLAILRHFQEHSRSALGLPDDIQQPYVKLSNAYWTVHSQLKILSGISTQSLLAMQKSVDIIRTRPQAEQHSGLLLMKLERLAEAFDAGGQGKSSREAMVQSIHMLIRSGALQDAVESAKTHSVDDVFQSNESTTTLGRMLKMYHRSFLKFSIEDASEHAFFDSTECSPSGRGLLLELQLRLYLKVLSRHRSWDCKLSNTVQSLSERLQEVYSPEQFPIRRLRVLILLLQLSQDHPDVLPHQFIQSGEEVGSDSASECTQDLGLVRYECHLKVLWKLKTSMREASPSISTFQEAHSAWKSLVDSTASWDDLLNRVDDVEIWLAELQTAIDYLATKGEEYACIPLQQLIVRILELEKSVEPSRLVTNLATLALQLLRLGYTGKAGLTFAKAEPLASHENTSTEAKLQWHLGYAEYLVQIGNAAKCATSLSAAEMIARQDTEFMSLAKPSVTLTGRIRFNRVLADACYVHSLLAIHTGHHKDAARHARQSVTLNRRIWAALESKTSLTSAAPTTSSDADVETPANSTFDPLSSLRNDNGIPIVMSITHGALNGPNFWPLVPSLYRALMQQSHVFAHQGLLQEAVHVAEQAEKVASAVNARSLVVDNSSHRAEYWAQGGRADKAQTALTLAEQYLPYKHISVAGYYSSLARICHLKTNSTAELEAYDTLEKLLNELSSPAFIKEMVHISPSVEEVIEQMSAITLKDPAEKVKSSSRTTRSRKPTSAAVSKAVTKTTRKPAAKAAQPASVKPSSIGDECLTIRSLRADVVNRKALAYLVLENIAQASELLSQVQTQEHNSEQSVLHLWTQFKVTLSQSLKQLATNFTFNTLLESTIALPAVGQRNRKSSEGFPTKRVNIPSIPAGKGSRGKKGAKEDFVTTLREARERLIEAHNLCAQIGSSAGLQQASFALSHVTVLLSAVSNGDLRGSLHPLYVSYMSEIPKSNALRLTQESIEVERETQSREEYLRWPELNSETRATLAPTSEFQKEYIDIIPPTWTAISLALSENLDELYITRYESGLSPFVLRLPMARHASRDMDEEEFSFEQGKKDFDEIIELSDFSTRSAKDMTSREARLQWWTEREALDTRLHELLINIENIWLGGFKGVFSQHTRRPDLLARFRKSFESILDRHLPSRQGKAQQQKAILDPRILELFIGLGDATNEQIDLDEALMDLIYFAVDILQFNGEHNAFDEIDFDVMVIETLDALRAYHSASQSASLDSPQSQSSRHTILILDKSLHIFPWESLPCLQSLATSRLPSLSALRDRILTAKLPVGDARAQDGHYVSTGTGGASILNPSGDLTHTLRTIMPRLDALQGDWTHITNRAPSEKEFESALKNKELVLYFGHGSGAQFVRSKSVRRLYSGTESSKPGCATTLLFGCSSVHLTENGIYEPSGMLASYLTAGAPAVVGMLWDVTDKDCDRFAVKAGELWGLWPELHEDDVPKTAKKSKGKGKVAQFVAEVESARGAGTRPRAKKDSAKTGEDAEQSESVNKRRRRGVALDEAVREARNACVLRYLNGAAAVVYGIPVYLD